MAEGDEKFNGTGSPFDIRTILNDLLLSIPGKLPERLPIINCFVASL